MLYPLSPRVNQTQAYSSSTETVRGVYTFAICFSSSFFQQFLGKISSKSEDFIHFSGCLISHHVTHSHPFQHSGNTFTQLNSHPSQLTVMHPLRVYSKSYSRNTSFRRTCSSGDLSVIFKFSKLLCKHSISKSDV